MPRMAEDVLPPSGAGDRCAQCNAGGVPLHVCDDPDQRGSAPTSSKPRFCNNCMIGKKVKVFWPVDESWYTGTVHEYDASTGEHLLRYNDGDSEWVRIGENATAGMAVGGRAHDLDPLPADTMDGHLMQPNPSNPGSPDLVRNMVDPSMRPDLHPGGPYAGPFPPQVAPGMMQFPGMAPPGMYAPAIYPVPFTGTGEPPKDGKTNGAPAESGNSPGGDSLGRRKAGPKAWTKEEDAILLNIVQTMQMPMKWSVVAQSLPDRTGKQCRERYVNHLNPRLKVSDWTPVEDATIFHLYNTIGSHWAKMSKVIPGRTDNGIKNRFHNLRRQFEREDEHRLRLSSENDFPEEIRLDRLRKFPEHLKAKSDRLWDMESAIGVLAAQSISGSSITRSKNLFGPYREPEPGELCVRCGFVMPSVQTGVEVCNKTGWCQSCTRIPPHVSNNLLRECLTLRRAQDEKQRKIVESWENLFAKIDDDHHDEFLGTLEEHKLGEEELSGEIAI